MWRPCCARSIMFPTPRCSAMFPVSFPAGKLTPQLEMWAKTWYQWVSTIFLENYLRVGSSAQFLPQHDEEIRIILGAYMMERALTEIQYELEHRPQWIRIPVSGILDRSEEHTSELQSRQYL